MITKKINAYFGSAQPTAIAVLCILFSFLFYTPNLTSYAHWMDNSTLRYIVGQVEDPWSAHGFENNFSHEAKLGLRLTVPLVMKLIFINDYKTTFFLIYFLKVLMGVILFRHIYKKLLEFNCSRKLSVLFLMNLTTIYLGYSFTRNVVHFDEFAFFLIYFAYMNKKIVIQGLCILLAIFTDERAIFSVFLLLLIKFFSTKEFSKHLFVLVLVTCATLILRQIIGSLFNIFPRNDDGGIIPFQLLRELRYSEMLLGLFFAFKLLWLFLIFSLDNLLNKANKLWYCGILTLIIAYVIVGFSVIDVTRTVTYIFPILLIILLHNGIPLTLRISGFVIPTNVLLALNLVIPTVHVESSISVPANLLIKVLAMKFGINPV